MNTPATVQAEAPADLVELGRIVSAYGVRGWIKVQPHSSNGQVLLAASTWWLKAPVPVIGTGVLPSAFAARVTESRPHGSTIVAALDGVPDRERADAMKGHTVWVPRAEFPAADDDEYYWVDLIGCRLFGESDGRSVLIGEVLDVIDNGAHGVLRVARSAVDDQGGLQRVRNEKGKVIEVLVPFVRAHVHTVDIANKRLDSNWPAEF